MSISLTSAAFLFSTPKPFLLFFPQRFLFILFRNCSLQPKLSSAALAHQHPVNSAGVWSCLEKNKTKQINHLDGAISDLSEQENAFLKYNFQNICYFQNMPTSACVAVLTWEGSPCWALHPHFYIMQFKRRGKKKIPQHPTHFFGFSFFPF